MVANCLFTITNELNAQFCNLNFEHLHSLIEFRGIENLHAFYRYTEKQFLVLYQV